MSRLLVDYSGKSDLAKVIVVNYQRGKVTRAASSFQRSPSNMNVATVKYLGAI